MIRLHSTDKLTQLLKVIRGISSFFGSNRRHSLGLLALCNGFCLLPFQTPGGTKFPQVESVVYMFPTLEHKDSQIFGSGTLKSQWSTQLAFLQPLLWKLLGFCIAFFARNTWDVFGILFWTVTEACSNIEVSLVLQDNSRPCRLVPISWWHICWAELNPPNSCPSFKQDLMTHVDMAARVFVISTSAPTSLTRLQDYNFWSSCILAKNKGKNSKLITICFYITKKQHK